MVLVLILIGYKVYYELFNCNLIVIVLQKPKQTQIAFDTQANMALVWHSAAIAAKHTLKWDAKFEELQNIASFTHLTHLK